ncbi:hypothetical protein DPMN_116474 [Dreissena polymorpha]|uniref:Uncharacterized protein n=1 Tax=Dreissena polymorpha TaxID=45954 RepID=A0A9D4QTZ5_DREPO|nr:hypothetical protein DPMN_116474 [Dreissena polymorpha]
MMMIVIVKKMIMMLLLLLLLLLLLMMMMMYTKGWLERRLASNCPLLIDMVSDKEDLHDGSDDEMSEEVERLPLPVCTANDECLGASALLLQYVYLPAYDNDASAAAVAAAAADDDDDVHKYT